jgi:uncharacterized membrane protein YqaE (UPF0057 family)
VYYLIAILLPPLAVLLARKPGQAILNLGLTLLLWVPGMVHALVVVHNFYAEQRQDWLVEAVRRSGGAAR